MSISNANYGALGGVQSGVISGETSQQELQQLIKAISAGHDDAIGGGNASGYALRPESLERTLKVLTYRDKHVRLFKMLKRVQAFSTVEEYNRLLNYGGERVSAFTPEGSLPTADDSSYERAIAKIKFMGTLRAVSHPMGLVTSAHGNVIDLETNAGTLWLMRQIEKALFFGDETVNSVEWDGIIKQVAQPATNKTFWDDPTSANCSGFTIDCRDTTDAGAGSPLTPDMVDDAAEKVFDGEAFGQLDTLFYSTGSHRQFSKNFATKDYLRVNVNDQAGGPLKMGWTMGSFASNFGDLSLEPDVFLSPVKYTTNSVAASGDASLRPNPPTLSVAEAANGGAWGTSLPADLKYFIVAVNKDGNSAASDVGALGSSVDNATQKINITIAKSVIAGSVDPEGYIIYRSDDEGASYYEVGRTKYTGGANQVYVDVNQIIAGTGVAVAMTMQPDVVAFRQLAPFVKIPLAQIDLNTRWAQVLYGAPVVYAPKKCCVFYNVKDS